MNKAALKKLEADASNASDVLKVVRAAAIINHTTKSKVIEVHNSMWCFTCKAVKNSPGEITFLRVPVTHNPMNKKVAHEITNNIIGNPMCEDLTQKFHEPNMGTDMHCFLTYNKKCTLSHVMILVSPEF